MSRRLMVALAVAVAAGTVVSGAINQVQMPGLAQSLTSELIRKFLATQDALRELELRRPPTGIRWAADDAELARLLDEDPDAKGICPGVGWTSLEYATTHSTIMRTLMAMSDLDSGQAKGLPGDVSEANVRFLRRLPDDVAADFVRWRQANVDEALQELREIERKR